MKDYIAEAEMRRERAEIEAHKDNLQERAVLAAERQATALERIATVLEKKSPTMLDYAERDLEAIADQMGVSKLEALQWAVVHYRGYLATGE